jgi:hypothetical protein
MADFAGRAAANPKLTYDETCVADEPMGESVSNGLWTKLRCRIDRLGVPPIESK